MVKQTLPVDQDFLLQNHLEEHQLLEGGQKDEQSVLGVHFSFVS